MTTGSGKKTEPSSSVSIPSLVEQFLYHIDEAEKGAVTKHEKLHRETVAASLEKSAQWIAVAQVHATLALACAQMISASQRGFKTP